jgi:hypothetical protein
VHVAVNALGFAVELSGGLKFSGFDFNAKLSLQTTGSFAVDASLTTTGTFLVNASLTGIFQPASGAFSMTGTGKLAVPGIGSSIDTGVTVNTTGVTVSFDFSTPIGGIHFGGEVDSGGFDLSASVNIGVNGTATIDKFARVSGSVSVGGSATISSSSGFSASLSASFNGNGCFYNAFNDSYDIACISINLGSGSVSLASDLRSITFSALGSSFSIPLV